MAKKEPGAGYGLVISLGAGLAAGVTLLRWSERGEE